MTLKNKNPWKIFSVGLLGIIGIGLLAPVDASSDNANSGWQVAVAGLQSQIDAIVSGDFQVQINDVVADVASHTSADGDLSDNNEIQSLSETDGIISLSGDGSVTVQDRVSGTCAVGSSIREIAADGTVTCEDDTDTKYTAGTGMSQLGTQFSVNTGQIQKRVTGSCAADSSIRIITNTGGVVCEPDDSLSGLCPSGQFVRGVTSFGTLICGTP